MNEPAVPAPSPPTTAYEAFLDTQRGKPSAAACEQWADEHAGDPAQARALVDAGWLTARSSRSGSGAAALALFRRAADGDGEHRLDARVGIVDQLYALGRTQDAERAQEELRTCLDAEPAGSSRLRVIDDMVEVLAETGRHEHALTWCQAGLDAIAADEGIPQAAKYRHGLLIHRGFLRSELGIELDEDDLAAEAEADASLTQFRDSLLEALSQDPAVDGPEDAEAFDGILLRWVRDDFAAVRARWPESTASYGDDYDTYAARLQHDAHAYSEAGAARIRIVSATLAEFEEYARRHGREPGAAETRRAFSEWHATTEHPERALLWPPARNGPCWCESNRKYKKCCGAPARN
ncbi:SEC-C domain-containing protein [Streptomyces noursei]|uniref:SEC-C domain-containing protein n=1 Tax=Streptomyces noursei TaxID=1971 RepID=UPI00081D19E6|nr:SEC-C motif-containing protein [Streptomyces noursei ATCC 11455]MCZ0992201.1 SEC-C domain-containing protein [Streptomyces noursei]